MPLVDFKNDEIEFPDSMSGDEIMDVLGAIASSAGATAEFIGTLGTGAIAEPIAGLAGLATGSADNVRRVQSMLTYRPRTAAGQRAMHRIGQDLASMAEETGLDNVSGYWRDRVVPALQEQAGPIAGSMLAAGGLAALTMMGEAGGGGTARGARRIGMNAQEGAIKAFHGSPHDFPPVRELQMPDGAVVYQSMSDAIPVGAKTIKEHPLGRFDMSKIGTGEGAQAYGHGLYFAEAEDVAKGYRDELQKSGMSVDGNQIPNISGGHTDVDALADYIERTTGASNRDAHTAAIMTQSATSKDDAIQKLNKRIEGYKADGAGEAAAEAERFKSIIGRLDISRKDSGSMFEVNIDAEPDELLDWDLPLSEQSDGVRSRLAGIEANYDWQEQFPIEDVKGSSLYAMGAGGSSAQAAKNLSDRGIKGIRYKDGMSRGETGGTSNYVIFDDKTISIARKYGITLPAAAAMLAAQGEGDAPL